MDSVASENIDQIFNGNDNDSETRNNFKFPQSEKYQEKYMRSGLQCHCAYFDRDCDGIISVLDTFRGLHALGFNPLAAIWGTVFIHITMAYQTSPTLIPSLTLPIYLERIHKSQHGSDTKIYDHAGRLQQTSLSAIQSNFMTLDSDKQGGLKYSQILSMLWNIKSSYDPFGLLMGVFWWTCLYLIAANKNGILPIQYMMAQYDGSLFYMIEQQRKLKLFPKRK